MTMTKLLKQYVNNPSEKLAQRIKIYDNQHMLAKCLLNPEEMTVLNTILGK